MRIVLADLQGKDGFVTKDTIAGGYGSRFRPFSRVTGVIYQFKRRYFDIASVQMAYLAAICARQGHKVAWTRGRLLDGDAALVLSSLVDHRNETAWAQQMRARGVRVGFVGLAASIMPGLFADHADFVIRGEPEEAVARFARGEKLEGLCVSPPIENLDSLPFPRWDLVVTKTSRWGIPLSARPLTRWFYLLASRGCREFCTYCPHRILAPYRARSVGNIVDEVAQLCHQYPRPYVIFRDPVFTENRDRCLALCDEIRARSLDLQFECETRLDCLDVELLERLHEVGLRAIGFGVESVSARSLHAVGRRAIPQGHQRAIIEHCRHLGIQTAAFYILGFPSDDWQSIAATIDFAIALDSTFAQFKILTPFPGTPLWKQVEPAVYKTDWEQFDGFTPTFTHPHLAAQELRFLLGAAYKRFYMRPSFLANLLDVENTLVRTWVTQMDRQVSAHYARGEIAAMSRPVSVTAL
jgi:anaerobic magnesium-protoporphyrin IX monomethyl ester cyclase